MRSRQRTRTRFKAPKVPPVPRESSSQAEDVSKVTQIASEVLA